MAATSREIADEAARRIQVDYDPLPLIDDPFEAVGKGVPLVHEDWQSFVAHPDILREGNVCSMAMIVKGDVEAAFLQAECVYEDRFTTASVHQAYLEPRAALAVWEPGGCLTVHSNT